MSSHRSSVCWSKLVGSVLVWAAVSACGSPVVKAGLGVGNAGQGLVTHADRTARSAEVCLLKGALGPQAGAADKSMAETCLKAQKDDLLLRRAMLALSLYGTQLELAATGEDAETSGKLEAALSGVEGTDWSDAEDQATRDAVTQLVTQMNTQPASGKIDLNKVVQQAAPHVKTLCTSLSARFDAQLGALAEIRRDVDKKSQSKSIRRCGTYETHAICVADTVVDRMVYAEVFARTVAMENATFDAKESTLRFCTAHDKLAEAAQKGEADKKETYASVVEAIKTVPRNQPDWQVADGAKPAEPANGKAPAADKK